MGLFGRIDEAQGINKSKPAREPAKVRGERGAAKRFRQYADAVDGKHNGLAIPKAPKAGVVKIYYDTSTRAYYSQNAFGEWMTWNESMLKVHLRRSGYFTSYQHENGLSYLEEEMHRITNEQNVHYAGPLGGYAPGVYEIFTSRVLVTRGPTFLVPREGKWPTLRRFLEVLLADQCKYFFGWLRTAVVSLRKGPPWAPGQLLAIGGPPGCGKSVLQSLITPLLGGRVSSPFTYMSSGTNFNAEIYGAEHGLIGDVNHAIDPRARRNFGSAIKKLVAEPLHYLHAKGRTPITLTPFLRLTLTLNDNPQALHVLPSFDSDVAGKLMLLRARTDGKRIVDQSKGDWQAFYGRMLEELPAMVWHLLKWRIPEGIADERYSVVSFHDPELIEKVNELSEEEKLLDLIDTFIFEDRNLEAWEGTSTELEKLLGERMSKSGGCTLFRYSSHCGQLLETLARKNEERITRARKRSNKWSYLIRRV